MENHANSTINTFSRPLFREIYLLNMLEDALTHYRV